MSDVDEDFDKGVDYTGVEDEETLTPAQLGYTGNEDYTPFDAITDWASDVGAPMDEDEVGSVDDSFPADSDAVEHAVDDK